MESDFTLRMRKKQQHTNVSWLRSGEKLVRWQTEKLIIKYMTTLEHFHNFSNRFIIRSYRLEFWKYILKYMYISIRDLTLCLCHVCHECFIIKYKNLAEVSGVARGIYKLSNIRQRTTCFFETCFVLYLTITAFSFRFNRQLVTEWYISTICME